MKAKLFAIAVVLAANAVPAVQAEETSTIDYLGLAIAAQANAVGDELLRATEAALAQTLAEIKLVFSSDTKAVKEQLTVAEVNKPVQKD